MLNQLELIAKSYDRHIMEHGKKEALSYDNLPDYITKNPDYAKYRASAEYGAGGSENTEIRNYLQPDRNKKFIDLGCCLNLMLKGYDQWPSLYYGVDISSKTIQLLNQYVTNKHLHVGMLYCGSIHETPFDDSSFDIGACIGVLEYYERDFLHSALTEVHRIMKPLGKLVIDIPHIESPAGRIMMQIEKHMGRPDKFDMLPQQFENMLQH